MVNAKEKLGALIAQFTKDMEDLEEKLKLLESLDSTSQIQAQINGLKSQIEAYEEALEAIEGLAGELPSWDLILEKFRIAMPAIKVLMSEYGREISGIVGAIYEIFLDMEKSLVDKRAQLYNQEAVNLRKFFDALKEANFSDEEAIRIVASQGAPGSLAQIIGQLVRVNLDIDN